VVATQEFGGSKYDFEGGVEIDCASRYHLCKAACCKLSVSLSREDVEEQALRWDPSQPYLLARGADRRCVHQDRASGRCGVYAYRPLLCRAFDCSKDQRIWLDFERGIINPQVHAPNWPPDWLETAERQLPAGGGPPAFTLMAESRDEDQPLMLVDANGAQYRIPRAFLEQARLTETRKALIEKLFDA